MRRDPLDRLRLMPPIPHAPAREFEAQLDRRMRRALEPILRSGGSEMTQTTNPLHRHGHLSYIEVPAVDAARSAGFYETIFGWTIRSRDSNSASFDDPNGDLIGHFVTGRPIARETGTQLFISVDSVDETLQRIVASGGEVAKQPYPEGELWVATFHDPAGNLMGIWQRGPREGAGAEPAAVPTPSITAGLSCQDAQAEIRWLTEVLGFRLTSLFEEPDGRVAFSELSWGDGAVHVSTRGDAPRLGQTGPASIALTVADERAVDGYHERAVAAGAEVVLPPEATFYGGYGFSLRDPEGNLWHLGKPFLDTEQARNLPQRRL